MAQYENDGFTIEEIIQLIKYKLKEKYAHQKDKLDEIIHTHIHTKYENGKGLGSQRGYLTFLLPRDLAEVEKLMSTSGGKKRRKTKRKSKRKKRRSFRT